jgi:hypothetical protein
MTKGWLKDHSVLPSRVVVSLQPLAAQIASCIDEGKRVLVADSTDVGGVRSAGQCDARRSGGATREEACAPGAKFVTLCSYARAPQTLINTLTNLISLAAVIGAALPVAIWAKSRKSHLLYSGAPLAGLLPVVM